MQASPSPVRYPFAAVRAEIVEELGGGASNIRTAVTSIHSNAGARTIRTTIMTACCSGDAFRSSTPRLVARAPTVAASTVKVKAWHTIRRPTVIL